MSTEQAGSIVIQVTARDFERLCENSGNWAGWEPPLGRFENLDGGHPTTRQWRCCYWLGSSWTTVILARAFLDARGHDHEILWDMAEHPNGAMYGYVILTDYQEGQQS